MSELHSQVVSQGAGLESVKRKAPRRAAPVDNIPLTFPPHEQTRDWEFSTEEIEHNIAAAYN